jgi:hypothetical protein
MVAIVNSCYRHSASGADPLQARRAWELERRALAVPISLRYWGLCAPPALVNLDTAMTRFHIGGAVRVQRLSPDDHGPGPSRMAMRLLKHPHTTDCARPAARAIAAGDQRLHVKIEFAERQAHTQPARVWVETGR